MKMVAVERVARRRQHDVEIGAGAFGDIVQEVAAWAVPAPIGLDGDAGAVGELEAADIDGVAARMLAEPPVAAILAAAGIGAEMMDEGDGPAEMCCTASRSKLSSRAASVQLISAGRFQATALCSTRTPLSMPQPLAATGAAIGAKRTPCAASWLRHCAAVLDGAGGRGALTQPARTPSKRIVATGAGRRLR